VSCWIPGTSTGNLIGKKKKSALLKSATLSLLTPAAGEMKKGTEK
jgi:hypothetical protein